MAGIYNMTDLSLKAQQNPFVLDITVPSHLVNNYPTFYKQIIKNKKKQVHL